MFRESRYHRGQHGTTQEAADSQPIIFFPLPDRPALDILSATFVRERIRGGRSAVRKNLAVFAEPQANTSAHNT